MFAVDLSLRGTFGPVEPPDWLVRAVQQIVTKATLRAACFNSRVTWSDAQHWAQVRRGQTRRKPRLRRIGRAFA